jgi:hypothetical protein
LFASASQSNLLDGQTANPPWWDLFQPHPEWNLARAPGRFWLTLLCSKRPSSWDLQWNEWRSLGFLTTSLVPDVCER